MDILSAVSWCPAFSPFLKKCMVITVNVKLMAAKTSNYQEDELY